MSMVHSNTKTVLKSVSNLEESHAYWSGVVTAAGVW